MPRATLKCPICGKREEVESLDVASYRRRFVEDVQAGWTVRPSSTGELLCPSCTQHFLDTGDEPDGAAADDQRR